MYRCFSPFSLCSSSSLLPIVRSAASSPCSLLLSGTSFSPFPFRFFGSGSVLSKKPPSASLFAPPASSPPSTSPASPAAPPSLPSTTSSPDNASSASPLPSPSPSPSSHLPFSFESFPPTSLPLSYFPPPLPTRLLVSRLFFPQLKEPPAVAASLSHSLLLRAGFIRQTGGSGLYTLLPLSHRVICKIDAILDRFLSSHHCNRLDFSLLTDRALWEQSGRWDSAGAEMFRLKDRRGADFSLSPTHEELVTALVREDLLSPRQLPLRLYNVGKKFRDELRPRAGLLRAREFIMHDAYSFDAGPLQAEGTYEELGQMYERALAAMGVEGKRVEADCGTIGGERSDEIHVLAEAGEDAVIMCDKCSYAANREKAVSTVEDKHLGHAVVGGGAASAPSSSSRSPSPSPSPASPSSHTSPLVNQYLESLLPFPSRFLRDDVRRKFEVFRVLVPHTSAFSSSYAPSPSSASSFSSSPPASWQYFAVALPASRSVNPIFLREHVGGMEVKAVPLLEQLPALASFIPSAPPSSSPSAAAAKKDGVTALVDDSLVRWGLNIDSDLALEKEDEEQEEDGEQKEKEEEEKRRKKEREALMTTERLGIKREDIAKDGGSEIDMDKLAAVINERVSGERGEEMMREWRQKARIDPLTGDVKLGKSEEERRKETAGRGIADMTPAEVEQKLRDLRKKYEDEGDEEGDGQGEEWDDFSSTGSIVIDRPVQGLFRSAASGDRCPSSSCTGTLRERKGIEVGHIFLLGSRYSRAMGLAVTGPGGKQKHVEMGCYGVGVSRLMAAAVEAYGDEQGIVWPMPIAPYKVVIVPAFQAKKGGDAAASSSMPPFSSPSSPSSPAGALDYMREAESLYDFLQFHHLSRGEVLLDDRMDMQMGQRLRQAQLAGIPLIVVMGRSMQERGLMEVEMRATGEKRYVNREQLIDLIIHMHQHPIPPKPGNNTQDNNKK